MSICSPVCASGLRHKNCVNISGQLTSSALQKHNIAPVGNFLQPKVEGKAPTHKNSVWLITFSIAQSKRLKRKEIEIGDRNLKASQRDQAQPYFAGFIGLLTQIWKLWFLQLTSFNLSGRPQIFELSKLPAANFRAIIGHFYGDKFSTPVNLVWKYYNQFLPHWQNSIYYGHVHVTKPRHLWREFQHFLEANWLVHWHSLIYFWFLKSWTEDTHSQGN